MKQPLRFALGVQRATAIEQGDGTLGVAEHAIQAAPAKVHGQRRLAARFASSLRSPLLSNM